MKKVKDLEINFLGEDFKYTGEVNEKNIPHGKGKLISSGKNYVFEGAFVNGCKNGVGVESYNNNYFVKCNFINNFAYGKGECVTKNTLYKGEIVNSLKHGNGEFIKQKDAYELSSLSCEEKEILKFSDLADGVNFLSQEIKPCDYDEFSIKNAKFLNDQLVYGEMLFDDGNQYYVGEFEQKDFNGKGRLEIKSRWCSNVLEKSVPVYWERHFKIKYDDCNPFSLTTGEFGEIENLVKHTSKTASASTIDGFSALSELFSKFMNSFELNKDKTEHIQIIPNDMLNFYTQFYNKALELYDNSLVSFTKNIKRNITKSGVIGLNHSSSLVFETDEHLSFVGFRALIAKLFGFVYKEEIEKSAEQLASIYANHRNNILNSLPTNDALDNGCFFASNGSFVFPIAIKNKLSTPVLTYLIIDHNGFVSVWVSDIDAVRGATKFDDDSYAEINNELYCKNLLFVTGPKLVNGLNVYEGVFRKSNYCGKGLLNECYEKNGKKIIHIVKDDFMFGKPNGICKDILVSEGKLHFYVGEMVNGLKDGKGEEKIYNVFEEDFKTDELLNHFDKLKKEFVYSFNGKWRNDKRNGLGVEKYSENEEGQTVIYDKDRFLKKVEK